MGKILKPDGTTVTSGEVIATIESAESAGATAASVSAEPGQAAETTDAVQEKTGSALALSPAVRRLVAEHNLDAGKIPGSGRDHRITKADVLAFLDTQAEETPVPSPSEAPPSTVPTQSTPTPQAKPQPAVTPAAAAPDSRGRVEQRVSMTRLRARIAERLIQAQQTAAILTTFNEANMQPVMDLRNKYKDRFEKEHGVRLGFMSFFVKACVEALKRYPAVNGSIDGTDIIYHGYYDIGIAVSSPRGLVVPILRDADQMGFSDIEKTIREFGQRAQDGSLTMEDLTGGTFSITNGGIFGSLLSTPILNPPQSGILGMHKIMDRPMAEGGQVVVRPMMYLAHSYDHRIVDGREAVGFLVTVKECLEDPARLLLQI